MVIFPRKPWLAGRLDNDNRPPVSCTSGITGSTSKGPRRGLTGVLCRVGRRPSLQTPPIPSWPAKIWRYQASPDVRLGSRRPLGVNRYVKANGLGCFLPFHRPCPDPSGQAMCGILFFTSLAGARLNATVKGIGAGAKSLLGPSTATTTITWAAAAAGGQAGGQAARNWELLPRRPVLSKRASLKFFLN